VSADRRHLPLVALTISTGSIDAISWFGLGKVFSAFMTGNLAFVGFRLASSNGPSLPRVLTSIAAFAIGAALSARVVRRTIGGERAWPPQVIVALAGSLVAETVFLAVWAAVGADPSARLGDFLIGLSALAMGIQTAAVFALGVRAVFTTAATATLAVLMGDFSEWPQSRGERWRLASVLGGLLIGAVVGTTLVVHAGAWAPLFPVAVTACVIAAAR
jgi:uncharacterized membrane protein YoaK (UPF0700 family)